MVHFHHQPHRPRSQGRGDRGPHRYPLVPSLEGAFWRLPDEAFCEESKMPWQECNPMDERLKFVAELLDREKIAVLCRRFGISRKTGYKILERYSSCGL
jgi:hypothetical protein